MLRIVLAFVAVLGMATASVAQDSPQLFGAVKTPLTLDEATLKGFPATTMDITFETSNGTESGTYTGVLLWDLIGKAELTGEGRNLSVRHFLRVTAADGYLAVITVAEADPQFGNTPGAGRPRGHRPRRELRAPSGVCAR